MKQREGSIEAAVRSGNQSSRGNKNKKGKTIKTKHPRATRTRRQLRDATTISTPSTTVLVRRRTPTEGGRRGRRNTTITLVLGLAIGVFFQVKNNGGFHPHLARFTGVDVRKVPTSHVHHDPPSSTSEPRGSVQFCLERRGTRGRWIQDWDYAHRSSYRNYGSGWRGATWHLADQNFTRTSSQPYRRAMSYRWIDDECPLQEVDVEKFCAACVTLGIHQILVLGDSLHIAFVQSLQSLLGFPPKGRRATVLTARFQPWTMACPPTNSPSSLGHTTITFWMMKYAPHSDWKKLGEEARNKSGRARDFIDKSKHKTAIVANLGAWMQDRTQYEEAFTWFLEWMESLTDPSKVVPFWRPTVPGHLGCHPEGKKEELAHYNWVKPVRQEPYTDYLEYKQTQDIFMAKDNADPGTNQRWEYFEGWNDWSYHKMYRTNSTTFGTRDRDSFGSNSTLDSNHSISETNSSSSSNTIHWLNVFPSAVLRRDGHIGFGDCLHYYLPGPIDWWSHLFHSALLDLANATTMTDHQYI